MPIAAGNEIVRDVAPGFLGERTCSGGRRCSSRRWSVPIATAARSSITKAEPVE